MAASHGLTGQPAEAGTNRPQARPLKPVVPAIPLAYMRRKNKTPAVVAQKMAPALEHEQRPSPNVTAPQAMTVKEASTENVLPLENQPNDANAPAKPSTPTPQAEPQASSRPRPEAEAAEPLEAVMESNTTGNEGSTSPLTTPSGTMALDTPPSDPSTDNPEGAASPTSTRGQVPPPNDAPNGTSNDVDQISHTSQPSDISNHETVRFPEHRASSNHSRSRQTHPSNGSFTSSTPYPAPYPEASLHQPNGIPPSMPVHATQGGVMGRHVAGESGRPLLIATPVALPSTSGVYHHPQRVEQAHPQHYVSPMRHSHHGSQSSIHADAQGYGPSSHGNRQSTYSAPSTHLPRQQFHPSHVDPTFNMVNISNPASGISGPDVQTLYFLQNSFGDREFSDCTLELRFVQQETSHELPCHRLVISRSPKLRHLLRSTTANPLVIEFNDPFMRPDAFIFTVRTLYGWDIDREPYLPAYRPPQDAKEALDLSLAYASAARYLGLPLVYATAIRHACQHLTWETIDRACQFALPQAIHLQTPWLDNTFSRPDYSAWELLDAVATFLVYNLSTDFFLDANAGDSGFSRLPATELAPKKYEKMLTSHSHRPTRSHHLSIQFGDLKPTITDTVLSRILLNLPYPMLKHVLEHPHLAQPSGELSRTQRHTLIEAVVGEREARRLRALDDPNLQLFADKLENASKPLVVQSLEDFHVNSMGFKEEAFDGDVPYILQSWIHSPDSVST